ncbi:MAG TPA: murein biosynthesis integral membrane protein MurJ [Tepidimicrobium sp.]|nr:murein biosynthesis integral membrane protein MurJ [Tepidimicrobium sp.]
MDSTLKKAFNTSRFIIVMVLLNKSLTLIKQILIAAKLGSGAETDTYFTGIVAAVLLANMVGEAITLGMEPVLAKIEEKKGKEYKLNYINNLLHITILLALGLFILNWFLSPVFIKIMVRGIEGKDLEYMLKLVRGGMPMGLFFMIRAIFIAFLHSEGSLRAGLKSWIYYFTAYILFLVCFSHHGIYGLMITGIIASILQLCAIVPAAINRGYRYRAILGFKDIYIREFFIALWPIILGTSINMINVIVDKSFASTLVTGSKSWLNYSDVIIHVFLGIFVMGIITIIVPMFGSQFNGEDSSSLKSLIHIGMRTVSSIVLPAMVVLITLANPIVKLLFERGQFTPTDTLMTSQVLTYYALGLASISIILILINCHYAAYDPITPIKFTALGVVANLILNWILIKPMAVNGLALATSLSNTLIAALLIRDIGRDIHIVNMEYLKKRIFKLIPITIAMVITILPIYYILDLIPWDNGIMDIIQLLISITAGIFTYTKLNMRKKDKLWKVHKKGKA